MAVHVQVACSAKLLVGYAHSTGTAEWLHGSPEMH